MATDPSADRPFAVVDRSLPARMAVALGAVALSAIARFALNPLLLDKFPLITFYPAIMVSAWFGGFWPGAASTVAAALIVAFVWLDPVWSVRISKPGDAAALLVFLGIGTVTGNQWSLCVACAAGREPSMRSDPVPGVGNGIHTSVSLSEKLSTTTRLSAGSARWRARRADTR